MGKAKNLKKRVTSYFLKGKVHGEKTSILIPQIKKVRTKTTDSEIEAFLLESLYIKKYKPKYNIKLTDDKAYLMVKITIKDDYPKVLTVRRSDDKGSIYFGPFPNSAGALRTVLKIVRKIFPYQSIPNHAKRICLYNHLGLCPCPPVFDSPEFKKEYGKTIKHIVDFLNGNTKKLIRELKKEREQLSANEEFEKASLIQKKIEAIKLITNPVYNKFDCDVSPNLTEDLLSHPLSSLRNILSENNIFIKKLERIECFDISNISGTNATGSMVVFINGEKDGSKYRKFKIRALNTPNDFAMMKEVLHRRIQHVEWPYPNLIIVDGGKGQISSALKVIRQFSNLPANALHRQLQAGLTMPIIGLTKRKETIITSDFKEISLPKDSAALKLIMRIRDEAHRFAITYHRMLRSKSLTA